MRDACIAGIIVFAVAASVAYFVYVSAGKALKQEVQGYILSLASSAAQLTDGDLHQLITRPEDQGNATYNRLREPFFKLLRANPSIAFIYTAIQRDDKIFFILDASIPDPGEEEDTSAVMEEYEDATETMLAALREQKPHVEEESYTDDWGTFLSAYAPFFNSKGEFLGIVGADIRLEDYNERLARIRNTFLLGTVISFFVSAMIGIAVWYARNAAIQSQKQSEAQRLQLEEMEKRKQEAEKRQREEQEAAEQKRREEQEIAEKRKREEQEQNKREAEKRQREAMHAMAEAFESSVQSVVEQVAQCSDTICRGLNGISEIATDTQGRTVRVENSSIGASQLSQQVANAAEELTKSVNEISEQTSASLTVALDANEAAEKASTTITTLSQNAERVGEVIQAINDIAAEINLLAINAAIEAVRAGDAGRGFSVVANAVKSLATQVSNATRTISAQIGEMQVATQYSVDAVMHIITIIDEVTKRSESVAAAVEEQSAVTREIAANIAQASGGVQQITKEIVSVKQGADNVQDTTTLVIRSAEDLSHQSTLLKEKVEEFLTVVRKQ